MIRDLDAEIATRQASIAKDQERVEKLGQKEVLQANEEKRLGKYRVRIAKKVEDLKAIQEQQAKQREAIRQRAERLARGGTQECNRGRRVRTKKLYKPMFWLPKRSRPKPKWTRVCQRSRPLSRK